MTLPSDAIHDVFPQAWPALAPLAQPAPHEEPAALAGQPAEAPQCPAPQCPAPERLSPIDVASLTVSLALWAGLVESVNYALRYQVWGTMTHFTPHLVWMAPVALLALFSLPGTIVAALAARMPRRRAFALAMVVLGTLFWFNLLLRGPLLALPAHLLLAAGLAVMTSRVLEPRLDGCLRVARHGALWSAGAVLVIAAIMLAGPRYRERGALASLPPTPSKAPNVLLVVLDAVRADELGIDVRSRAPTAFQRWADLGVTFEAAIAPSCWTLPSHAGMFTGLPPSQTKAHWSLPLDKRFATLAEVLQSRGYVTAGFVGNTHYCNRSTGLAQGFIYYEDFGFTLADFVYSTTLGRRLHRSRLLAKLGYCQFEPRKSGGRVSSEFLDWRSRQPRRPYFAFLNYFDAHHPYVAPLPYDAHHPRNSEERLAFRDWWWLDKLELETETVSRARLAYRDCVRYVDDQLGKLFSELERRGELDNTIVILTSDHGEHFGEHQLFLHGNSLYQPVVHVPLAIIWPGRVPAGKRVTSPVATQDLPATIVDLLGLEEEIGLPGESLARRWETEAGQGPSLDRPVRSEIVHGTTTAPDQGRSPVSRGPMKCVLLGRVKLIRNGDGVEELYDLAGDPQERVNRIEDKRYRKVLDDCRAALAETGRP